MEETFEIRTPGVDVENIMARVRERIEEKRRAGLYDRYNLSTIKSMELEKLKSDEAYLDYYLKTIWRAADVDLGDFPIRSKSPILGRPVVILKKIIWKFLKFYTFRLFSQQKYYNVKMASIAEGIDRKLDRRLAVLEGKIDKLKEQMTKPE